MYEIIKTNVYLTGIDLESPFPLGFGNLHHLPRVIFEILATDGSDPIKGIGEASIDFPFVSYDAWDIYWSLDQIELANFALDRTSLLSRQEIRHELLRFPAAFAAFNMAVDDVYGKAHHVSVLDMYGQQRAAGRALCSIPHQVDARNLVRELKRKQETGFVPKLKVGMNLQDDVDILVFLDDYFGDDNIGLALDFNAAYDVEQFCSLVETLERRGFSFERVMLWEQPTSTRDGVSGLVDALGCLHRFTPEAKLAADEVFLSAQDAQNCTRNGILLNFKVQRLGGIAIAREIETELEGSALRASGLVGGTFPTAIGRAYDQQCAAVLRSAYLPGDGWEPSTDWFVGPKHLIREFFAVDAESGLFLPFRGPGLGITVDWHKLKRFVIEDPYQEYRLLRQGKPGSKLSMQLRAGQSYQLEYEKLTNRAWDWNL